MFPLIPYKRILISTNLTSDNAMSLVSDKTSKPRSLFQWSAEPNKEFEGEISPNGFRIYRIISYRNSFLPILTGKFIPTDAGVQINVSMALHPAVLVFLIVWCTPFTVWILGNIKASFITGNLNLISFPLGMLAFCYVMVFFGFWFEVYESEHLIKEIFQKYQVIE